MGAAQGQSSMTSCRDAIKFFEASTERNEKGEKSDEAKYVKLYGMYPPITKIDPAALSTLKACEQLGLSSNNIDKIRNLAGMENLKILSLGRNLIKKLDNMDGLGYMPQPCHASMAQHFVSCCTSHTPSLTPSWSQRMWIPIRSLFL